MVEGLVFGGYLKISIDLLKTVLLTDFVLRLAPGNESSRCVFAFGVAGTDRFESG